LAHAGESSKGLGSVTLKINTQHTLPTVFRYHRERERVILLRGGTHTGTPGGSEQKENFSRDSAAQGRADADRPLTPTLLSNSVSQEFVAPTQNLKSRVGLRAGSESAPVVRRLGSCFYSSELRTFLFLRVNLGN